MQNMDNHNLVELSKCLRCGCSFEDLFHFFFHCQYYNFYEFRYVNDRDITEDNNTILHCYECLSLSEIDILSFFTKFLNTRIN